MPITSDVGIEQEGEEAGRAMANDSNSLMTAYRMQRSPRHCFDQMGTKQDCPGIHTQAAKNRAGSDTQRRKRRGCGAGCRLRYVWATAMSSHCLLRDMRGPNRNMLPVG
jgi:hypothetical protein